MLRHAEKNDGLAVLSKIAAARVEHTCTAPGRHNRENAMANRPVHHRPDTVDELCPHPQAPSRRPAGEVLADEIARGLRLPGTC